MSTTDKTADKLVQSIRKTKTATSATDKAPAVSAVSATPPRSATKKPPAATPAKPAAQVAAKPLEPTVESTASFQRRRVWPD
jgi:hypothetical protein